LDSNIRCIRSFHFIVDKTSTFFYLIFTNIILDSLSNQISKPSLPLKSSLKLPTTVTPLHIDVNAYHHPQFLLGNDDIVTSGKEEEKDSNSIQRNSTSTISDEVVKLSVDKEQGFYFFWRFG